MNRGLYIAASGMLAEQVRQDSITNDLANTTTPGYKPDRVGQRSFGEVLLANQRTGGAVGTLGAGAHISAQVTDLSPGAISQTGEPLDLAIDGEGFFAVQTEQGIRFTRSGRLATNAAGELTDGLGNRVLGQDRRPVRTNADGTVDGAKVGLFTVATPRKAGDGMFTGTAGAARAPGAIQTGAIEASGVDATQTMVDMLVSTRAYEAGQKSMQTIDSTLELLARQVGGLIS